MVMCQEIRNFYLARAHFLRTKTKKQRTINTCYINETMAKNIRFSKVHAKHINVIKKKARKKLVKKYRSFKREAEIEGDDFGIPVNTKPVFRAIGACLKLDYLKLQVKCLESMLQAEIATGHVQKKTT